MRGTKGCASGSSPRARTGSQTGAPSWSIVGSRRSAAATGVAAAGRTSSQHQHGAADAEEVCGHPLGAGWALCPWLCIPRDITAPARRAAPPAVEQGQAAGGGARGPRVHSLEPRCTHSTHVCRAAGTRVWLRHSCASIAACSVPPLRAHTQPRCMHCMHKRASWLHVLLCTRVQRAPGTRVGQRAAAGGLGERCGAELGAVWGWERCGAGAGWRPPAGRGGGVRHSLRRLLFYLVQSQFLECF